MKRMNEVFNFDSGVGFPASWSDEQVKYGDRAIKQVDALADALSELLDQIMTVYSTNKNLEAAENKAAVVLEAYRGE